MCVWNVRTHTHTPLLCFSERLYDDDVVYFVDWARQRRTIAWTSCVTALLSKSVCRNPPLVGVLAD